MIRAKKMTDIVNKSGIGNAENPEGIGRKATAKRFRTSITYL